MNAKILTSRRQAVEFFPSNQRFKKYFVKPTNAENFREIGSRHRRTTIARHLYHKIYVNSTPVPALVPSQCDGSGGPWQVERSHEIFRQVDERTPKNSVNSTTVPALVPAQYDGSGGPWQ